MDNTTLSQEQWIVAIEHLREDIQTNRKETREDIQMLRNDVNGLRTDLNAVNQIVNVNHDQLLALNTRLDTADKRKELTNAHWSSWTAIVVALATAVVMWIKG